MSESMVDRSQRKTARVAGLLYLLMTICGAFSMIYVDPKFYVPDDPTATVTKILASESLFRIGIASNLISIVLFLFVAYALYNLFKSVDKDLAMLMILLVVVSVPVGLNFNEFAPILLTKGAGYHSSFQAAQLQALAMTFLELQKNADFIGQVFWGLWLFPLGLLVFKSGFMPKVLGVLLIFGGVGYILNSLTFLLFPDYKVITYFGSLIGFVSEILFIFWLLIKGVNNQKQATSLTS
jgi:Domain of unknown function (DUF4386)